MILSLRTDGPVAELSWLAADGSLIEQQRHELGRQMALRLPGLIEAFLAKQAAEAASGLIFYAGPGSFTGLRIGAAVINSLAYAWQVPVVASNGAAWQLSGARRLAAGDNDHNVLPEYGAEAHITQPRK